MSAEPNIPMPSADPLFAVNFIASSSRQLHNASPEAVDFKIAEIHRLLTSYSPKRGPRELDDWSRLLTFGAQLEIRAQRPLLAAKDLEPHVGRYGLLRADAVPQTTYLDALLRSNCTRKAIAHAASLTGPGAPFEEDFFIQVLHAKALIRNGEVEKVPVLLEPLLGKSLAEGDHVVSAAYIQTMDSLGLRNKGLDKVIRTASVFAENDRPHKACALALGDVGEEKLGVIYLEFLIAKGGPLAASPYIIRTYERMKRRNSVPDRGVTPRIRAEEYAL